jgi:Dolichyl-phosphate-mannose-protein mannosyltransferase
MTASPSLASIARWPIVLGLALGLFLLAWLPRQAVTSAYLTTDEGNWMGRAALFARGTLNNDPLLTRQSGHPGVTTMYTALVGLGLDKALFLADYVRPDGLEKAPNYLDLIHQARQPFVVLSALAVVVIALLIGRLFGAGPALIVGVMLAFEPFLLAHAVVVHLDGMLTNYMTIALLSALIYWLRGGGRGYLLLCGLTTGLAFLTKTPSAILVPLIPGIALFMVGQRGDLRAGAGWRRLVVDGLIWGGLAGSLALLAWPSLRTDFIGTLQYMVQYTEDVGGGDHENFFRGQPISEPGPLYYVFAMGLRIGPPLLLGVLLLPLLLLPIGPRRAPREWRGPLLGLLVYIAAFTLMMMVPPKKFDRYLLPTFPAWAVLAALGYWLLLQRLTPRWSGRLMLPLLAGLAAAQVALIIPIYPYYMSYYNPLFGGGKAAEKNIVVGWGEGLEQVTEYLNAKPDADRLTLAGFYPRVLMAQFKGSVLPDKQYDAAEADYVVLYVNALQRDLANTLRTVTRGQKPELTVNINGIEYARLYSVPRPPGKSASGTEFGPLRLDRSFLRSEERRYLKSDDIHAGDTLQLTLRWTLLRPVDQIYYATFVLLDRQGRLLAEETSQVGGPDESTLSVRPGDFVTEVHQLVLPVDAVGDYDLAVAVRPGADAAPLAVTAWPERLAAAAKLHPARVVVDSVQASPPAPPADAP